MPRPSTGSRRVVVLSAAPPRIPASDAGTRYLTDLVTSLAADPAVADVLVLVPAFDSNTVPAGERVPGVRQQMPTRHPAVVRRLARRLHLLLARFDRTLPYLPFVLELLRGDLRRELRRADVIDLQWPELIRLARLVRLLNPAARVVLTHHDVSSQRYARLADRATSSRQRVSWAWATRCAERAERRTAKMVDASVVFSGKDAALLDRPGITPVTVIDPPMASAVAANGRPPLTQRPTVAVFVGYLARAENDDAARWLLAEIWPEVVARHPGARLRLVGSGASPELTAAVSATGSVELTGYVDDLNPEYAGARVCIVPVRYGAGVKFKVIEAMAAGVPLVLTAAGAEGIAGPERFARLTDDPTGLATAVAQALSDPDQEQADRVREWAAERYGMPRFRAAIRGVYGLPEPR